MHNNIQDRPSNQDERTTEFLITWKGCGYQDDTWEPEQEIDRPVILAHMGSEAWTGKFPNSIPTRGDRSWAL